MKCFAGLAGLAMVVASGCAPPVNDSISVRYAKGRVKIDGRTGEADWKKAHVLSLGEGRVSGEARLLWDEEYLYVAFTARFADRVAEDKVGLRLAGGDRLVHVMVQPDGACWDLIAAGRRPPDLPPELLLWAVHSSSKEEWTAEIRLSLTVAGAIGNPVTFVLTRSGTYRPSADGGPAETFRAEVGGRLLFDYGGK